MGHRRDARAAAAGASLGPEQIVAALSDLTRLGLGFFYPAWALCETVVHHQDIRLGLAHPRSIPADRLVVALDVLVKLPFITKSKRHTRKVAMRATDIDWSRGKGPMSTGPPNRFSSPSPVGPVPPKDSPATGPRCSPASQPTERAG